MLKFLKNLFAPKLSESNMSKDELVHFAAKVRTGNQEAIKRKPAPSNVEKYRKSVTPATRRDINASKEAVMRDVEALKPSAPSKTKPSSTPFYVTPRTDAPYESYSTFSSYDSCSSSSYDSSSSSYSSCDSYSSSDCSSSSFSCD